MKRRKLNRIPVSERRARVIARRNRRSPDELREVALGIHHGRIFTDRHCRSPREVESSFPILSMLDERTRKSVLRTLGVRKDRGTMICPGLIYEEISKAAPLGVNGLPMFFSMKLLTAAEHRIVSDRIEALRKAEQAALA